MEVEEEEKDKDNQGLPTDPAEREAHMLAVESSLKD